MKPLVLTVVAMVVLAAPARGEDAPTTRPAGGAEAEAAAVVTTVDGETFTGRPVALDAVEATFRTPVGERKCALRDLLGIRLAAHPDLMTSEGATVIVLAGGGMLSAEKFSIAGGTIRLRSELLGDAEVSLTAASDIYLPRTGQQPAGLAARHAEIKLPLKARDYLIAEDPRRNWVPIAGELKGVEADKVTFLFEQSDRTVDLAGVRVIQLARVPQEPRLPAGSLLGRDGSIVPFSVLRLAGGKLSLAADGIKADKALLAAVAEVRFRSDRAVFLSDLEPARVQEAGLLGTVFRYRKDRSAGGGPIVLGRQTFAKGLGLHSRCELTYALDGKYATFAAVAGIDRAVGNRGDAALRIIGDGKDLIKPARLTGGAEPLPIRCPVAGVARLTILADFGDDRIDVGDHVNLGDARLIKP